MLFVLTSMQKALEKSDENIENRQKRFGRHL
jgi:hypothetical protein